LAAWLVSGLTDTREIVNSDRRHARTRTGPGGRSDDIKPRGQCHDGVIPPAHGWVDTQWIAETHPGRVLFAIAWWSIQAHTGAVAGFGITRWLREPRHSPAPSATATSTSWTVYPLRSNAPPWLACTSRWLDVEDSADRGDEAFHAWVSDLCLHDIELSFAVLAFVYGDHGRGLFVELGYALAHSKPIVALGDRVSSFLFLPAVIWAEDMDSALTLLARVGRDETNSSKRS
jgi:hypothetical protein